MQTVVDLCEKCLVCYVESETWPAKENNVIRLDKNDARNG